MDTDQKLFKITVNCDQKWLIQIRENHPENWRIKKKRPKKSWGVMKKLLSKSQILKDWLYEL